MNRCLLVQGDAERLPLPDASVDLVFGSPPYLDARLYLEDGRDIGIARDLAEWVEWMLKVTAECLRVSRGAVVWVAAGKSELRNYQHACELLMADWFRGGGSMYRPCYWHRYGIPGSGSNQWFRADIEHVMCFKRPGKLPWTDNTAMGGTPKFGPGGAPSYREADGQRVNAPSYKRFAIRKGFRDLGVKDSRSVMPERTNPGNLISTGSAGGGSLGHDLAHENEAPFPEALAEFFVRSLCPPGGRVLDPFSGSATTAAVSLKHGREAVGLDLRRSQCALGTRRVADSLRPVSKLDPKAVAPLPGQLDLFPSED